ncbi:hypothetical protein UNDYM_5524 [Undibacterium sp. YM2]|uniref:hypothetical protein n=1 Tax=Undibacterium sp. YM2 TaxID=2058625 RepID=UPI001331C6EE|nr:hypothetical protein [Undibacterium sp. YM2]BBB69777.1 hypothetical protein UNDYM_5524 [Undibacterium sp. YM2]
MKPKIPRTPAMPDADTSLWDRIAFAMLGGLTGAAYAAVICLLMFGFTHKAHLTLIPYTSAVFACMGFFFGNVIVEAILCLGYALLGMLFAMSVISDVNGNLPANDIKTHLRYFFLLGIGSGLSFALFCHF